MQVSSNDASDDSNDFFTFSKLLLSPYHRGQDQSANYAHIRRHPLLSLDYNITSRLEELDEFINLVKVLLTLDVVFIVRRIV
jgi:hypothetical protein